MPARRDLFTGRLAFLERGWGGMEPFDVTLQQTLREGNVFSHIVTDHYHYFSTGGENYCQGFNTWDFYRGQEADPWISRVASPKMPENFLGRVMPQNDHNRTVLKSEEDYPGPKTMKAACQWLQDNKEADQFFLMVEAFDPHEPFNCPKEYLDLYDDEYEGPRFDWPGYKKVTEPSDAMEHIQKHYAANLTMIDHWFGKLLDVMDEQNLWEDTLVIFTTDHGLLLGEHEWTGKNFMHVYNEVAHLPLMVHVPGVSGGTRINKLTQNIDLMPTILEYFGLDVPSTVNGSSLLGLINRQSDEIRKYALYGMFGMTVNITDGVYTYLRAPVREENHPCFWYTAIPTSFRTFLGGDKTNQLEIGKFLPYTDFPVYKIPNSEEGAAFHFYKNVKESFLFNISEDYEQLEPIDDKELESFYINRLAEEMKHEGAPEEQYVRLGIK
jgi:hypothetical protein